MSSISNLFNLSEIFICFIRFGKPPIIQILRIIWILIPATIEYYFAISLHLYFVSLVWANLSYSKISIHYFAFRLILFSNCVIRINGHFESSRVHWFVFILHVRIYRHIFWISLDIHLMVAMSNGSLIHCHPLPSRMRLARVANG